MEKRVKNDDLHLHIKTTGASSSERLSQAAQRWHRKGTQWAAVSSQTQRGRVQYTEA